MDRGPGAVKQNDEIMDPSKIMGNIYIKEEIIIPDDTPEEGFEVEEEEEYQPTDENYQITAEGGSVLNVEPTEMEEQEPAPQSEQEVMFGQFEAWRKWKKLKRKFLQKNNIQVYEVYRNENYFVTHKYAGEEEFAYNE